MRDADDRRLGDVGVLVERSLDLGGVDVLAAADDDVLQPVDHVQVAVVVEPAEIAGVEPAVGEGLGGLLRQVEVPADDRRALQPDLADLARRQRLAVVGPAMRTSITGEIGRPTLVGPCDVRRPEVGDRRARASR